MFYLLLGVNKVTTMIIDETFGVGADANNYFIGSGVDRNAIRDHKGCIDRQAGWFYNKERQFSSSRQVDFFGDERVGRIQFEDK